MAQGELARMKGFRSGKDQSVMSGSNFGDDRPKGINRYKTKKTIQTKITTMQDVLNDSQEDNINNDLLVSLND